MPFALPFLLRMENLYQDGCHGNGKICMCLIYLFKYLLMVYNCHNTSLQPCSLLIWSQPSVSEVSDTIGSMLSRQLQSYCPCDNCFMQIKKCNGGTLIHGLHKLPVLGLDQVHHHLPRKGIFCHIITGLLVVLDASFLWSGLELL